MTCEVARERLQEAFDSRLAASARPALDEHLAGCAACRAYAAELERLGNMLAPLREVEPAPSELLARLGLEGQGASVPSARVSELASARRPRRKARWAWIPAGIAAAAVVLAIGLSRPLQPPVTEVAVAEADPAATILEYFGPEADEVPW